MFPSVVLRIWWVHSLLCVPHPFPSVFAVKKWSITSPSPLLIFFKFEIGSCWISQVDLDYTLKHWLSLNDPPATASRMVGITGLYNPSRYSHGFQKKSLKVESWTAKTAILTSKKTFWGGEVKTCCCLSATGIEQGHRTLWYVFRKTWWKWELCYTIPAHAIQLGVMQNLQAWVRMERYSIDGVSALVKLMVTLNPQLLLLLSLWI